MVDPLLTESRNKSRCAKRFLETKNWEEEAEYGKSARCAAGFKRVYSDSR